jgi:hypothetical protein
MPGYDGGVVCRWDAARSLVVVGVKGQSSAVRVYDSSDFVTFTGRYLQTFADVNQVYGFSMVINAANGDVYLFGSNYISSKYSNVTYLQLVRSGSTLTNAAFVLTDYFVGDGTYPPFVNAWYSGGKLHWIYTAGNNSPYSVKYDELSL